jgi:hypothetical protein
LRRFATRSQSQRFTGGKHFLRYEEWLAKASAKIHELQEANALIQAALAPRTG